MCALWGLVAWVGLHGAPAAQVSKLKPVPPSGVQGRHVVDGLGLPGRGPAGK